MIIHIDDQTDIYIEHLNEHSKEVILSLKYAHFSHHLKNIPVYRVKEEDLKMFLTTLDDVKYGINIVPIDKDRDFGEEKYFLGKI